MSPHGKKERGWEGKAREESKRKETETVQYYAPKYEFEERIFSFSSYTFLFFLIFFLLNKNVNI